MTKLTLTLVLTTFAAHASCGGTAIVDGAGGAAASNNSVTATSSSSGSPLCVTPEPVGALSGCSSGITTGTGGLQCQSSVCDGDGNIWTSNCSGSACVCEFNFSTKCSCVTDGATFCTGQAPSCCPDPFPP